VASLAQCKEISDAASKFGYPTEIIEFGGCAGPFTESISNAICRFSVNLEFENLKEKVSEMKLLGFTAEASLYERQTPYQADWAHSHTNTAIQLAQLGTCDLAQVGEAYVCGAFYGFDVIKMPGAIQDLCIARANSARIFCEVQGTI
jgi:hypothetical protein